MALSISQLVNDYGSYSGGTLVGELGARANVPSSGWGGVTGVPYPNITFIVRVDGRDYASSAWLASQKNGNPYIHQSSVARVNSRNVGLMSVDATPFANRKDELYAEVKSSTTLALSADKVLSYINYLLSKVLSFKTLGFCPVSVSVFRDNLPCIFCRAIARSNLALLLIIMAV